MKGVTGSVLVAVGFWLWQSKGLEVRAMLVGHNGLVSVLFCFGCCVFLFVVAMGWTRLVVLPVEILSWSGGTVCPLRIALLVFSEVLCKDR